MLVAYLAWKFIKGTTIVALADIPLEAVLEGIAEEEEEEVWEEKSALRFISWLWD